MGANRLSAACCYFVILSSCLSAQNSAAPPPQSQSSSSSSSSPSSSDQNTQAPSDNNESSSRHSHHRVRVPVDNEDSQPEELTDAESAIDKKDYVSAETLLQAFVQHDPTNYVAWFDLGFVENALGKVDQSIAAYRKSVAAKPDVFESNLNLGLQLAKTQQPDAGTFLRAATQLKPTANVTEGLYRAWLALARTVEQSNREEALSAYRKASAIQPKEAEPHLSIGELFQRGNNIADAESEYRQALALDPHSPDALAGLADIYMKAHRFPEAEECLRKLLVEEPDSAAVHLQLANVLVAAQKTDAAISELQAGLKLTPHNEDAEGQLADLYVTAGKSELADAAYRQLLAAHPNDAELHRRLGETLLTEKKFPQAQQEFATAIKLNPNLGEAYGGLAFAAGENKDYALAIGALDARSRLLPDIPIVYFLRASAYDHLRDFKQAATNYRLFLNSAQGKYPDQEWQAKHRLIAIEPKR